MGESRVENILENGEAYDGPILSRVEKLLKEGGSGGGSGSGCHCDDNVTPEHDLSEANIDDVMSSISTDND